MKLELGKIHIHDVQFGDTTKIDHGVLYVNAEEMAAVILKDDRLADCHIELERGYQIDVWYVFYVLSVLGNRSIVDFMGVFCSRE